MSATYVIDGYNLLHAMGVLGGGRAGPHGLEKARGRLLGLLHGTFGDEAHTVTVVFDGAGAPPGLAAEQHDRGMHILFAQGKQEADDVIEDLIGQASAPKTLQVVSNDHRVQLAARRRNCEVRSCDEFLVWLFERRRAREQPPEAPEKQERISQADLQHWLAEFADVEQDPSLKQAFEKYDFEDLDIESFKDFGDAI